MSTTTFETATPGRALRISLWAAQIVLAVDWAAAEGWNPGLADAACFAIPDAQGFFVGEIDGEPVATVSCINYDDRFAFLGFYIVRERFRSAGHGLRIWNAAIAHAGARVIGLDGVVAQQDNYKRSGFQLAYANIRYGGVVAAPPRSPPMSPHSQSLSCCDARRARTACSPTSPRAGRDRASCGTPARHRRLQLLARARDFDLDLPLGRHRIG